MTVEQAREVLGKMESTRKRMRDAHAKRREKENKARALLGLAPVQPRGKRETIVNTVARMKQVFTVMALDPAKYYVVFTGVDKPPVTMEAHRLRTLAEQHNIVPAYQKLQRLVEEFPGEPIKWTVEVKRRNYSFTISRCAAN
jgi:hypothetical protein